MFSHLGLPALPLLSPRHCRSPLANLTNRAVADVKIDRIQLAAAPVQTPLPLTVGAVRARSSAIVQAELDSQSLRGGQRYEVVMQGTYRGDGGAARSFKVRTFVVIPPPPEGSGQLGTSQVPSQKVEGGRYPPQPPRMDKDVNSGAPPVPTNPEVPGAPTPTGTEAQRAPIGDPPAIRFDRNSSVANVVVPIIPTSRLETTRST